MPLSRFISIKNVGRFINSAASGNTQLAKHVLVLGANGFGKTTLCAILRSLQTGDAALVLGRRTLGTKEAPAIDFLTDAGNVRFDGGNWTRALPELAIFDSTFVAENVHSGEIVDTDNKRNLYRVIVGQEGVALAQQDGELAASSRAKTADITASAKALQGHMPPGIRLEEFLKLPATPDIDARIAEQAKALEALRQAEQIKARPALAEMTIPNLTDRLQAVLAQTVEGIGADAERTLAAHLAVHNMTDRGENWLAEGMAHIADEKCPFCNQDVRGLPLIAAYRAVFGDAYAALKAEIATIRTEIAREFGDNVIGRLTTQIAANRGHLEFWQQYCTLAAANLDAPDGLDTSIAAVRDAALAQVDDKARTPLEAATINAPLRAALAALDQTRQAADHMNAAISAANVVIAARKASTEGGDVTTADAALNRLKAMKKRHEATVAAMCAAHLQLEAEKDAIETTKAAVRTKLTDHTKTVVKPYENRINDLLEAFNAGFRIAETTHAYPGGIATSSYQLVINRTAIELGDAKTERSRPSFKNTLSAGDRTTLALAFFLADLERDARRGSRIVVFDDPFSSQDAFRRLQTVFEIKKTGMECAQVIVLSHDAGFLRQVWTKCPSDQRMALQLTDHRALGSKISSCDLEEACKGRVANEIDDLLNFHNTGAGKQHDIVKKMRVVLETYCRASYPGSFEPTDMLGEIVGKIRKGGDQHPACALLDELDQINDYSKDHHHGDNPEDGTAEQLDPRELHGYVRRTLKVVNALQA